MSDDKPTSPTVADGDENHLIAERKAKLERLREKVRRFRTISGATPRLTNCTRATATARPNGSTRTRRV